MKQLVSSLKVKKRSLNSQTPAKICPQCNFLASKETWALLYEVCPSCEYHDKLPFAQRVSLMCDHVEEILGENHHAKNWLEFFDQKSYTSRLESAIKSTKRTEALNVFVGSLQGDRAVFAIFDFDFIAGSMSSAVGERFLVGVRTALAQGLPLICYASSGGARMQEGLYSLLQMKRTATALVLLAEARLPYIVIQGSPCMGGVTASLASLGDLHLAEPGALIGFSGPRVIAQTVAKTLPDGFQKSEFLLQHGFIDQIVPRSQLVSVLCGWLKKFRLARKSYAC